MTTVYKSKDIEYMQKLKKAVLTGMRGVMPQDKEYTWDYIRKQVTIDDLQTFMVNKLGRLVTFPTKHFNGDVMAIFLNKPSDNEIQILNKMMKQRAISEDKVYVTWLNKAEASTTEEKEVLTNTMNAELSIINPKLVLSFGVGIVPDMHMVTDFKDAKLMVTYDMDWLFKGQEVGDLSQRKHAMWNDVVELTKHYIKN